MVALARDRTIDRSKHSRNQQGVGPEFREELHAIDAVAAGQGIAMLSDVVVGRELKSGVLVKAHDLSLPGYGFYVVHVANHPEQPSIEAFSTWLRLVI